MNKYYEILKEISENKIDMTKLYILSCITYHKKDELLMKREMEMLDYIYDTWLEIDEHISLAKLCDVVSENWEDIQKDKYDYDDILIDLFN